MFNVLKGYPNIFFRSDDHFDHPFMIKGMVDRTTGELLPGARIPRPMFTTLEEMNETMISRHNERVRPGDRVYDLGDFCVKGTFDKAMDYRRRMNGQWYALEGNHDDIAEKMAKEGAFIWFRRLEFLSIGKPYFEDKKLITICHYAMETWPNSHHGSWHLYGHSHGMLPESWTCPNCSFIDPPHSLKFDVGVDCWNFYPVSIEEVKAKMDSKLPAWEAYRESLKGSGRVE